MEGKEDAHLDEYFLIFVKFGCYTAPHNSRAMKIQSLFFLLYAIEFGHPVSAQTSKVPDTSVYGNILLSSNPREVRVEIPALAITNYKTDEAIKIEFLPPGKYLFRVSRKKDVLEYEIVVNRYKEVHVNFDLKKKKVTIGKEDFVDLRNFMKTEPGYGSEFIDSIIENSPRSDSDEIFTVVEEQPSYPGGEEKKIKFLQDNIHYPNSAIKKGIQGKVFVTFVVEKDGLLSNVRVLRGIGGGCDDEAMRVVKLMPRWKPGRQRGTLLRVQFNLPIKFTLTY